MNLPISVTVQSLVAAMLAKSGLRSQFHLMVTLAMGRIEGATNTPTDYELLVDVSGSMGNALGDSTRLDVVKAACEQAISLMGPADRVGISSFHGTGRNVLPFTLCNDNGKINAINAVYGMNIGQGGTDYGAGLLASEQRLYGSDRKRALVFFTDGENTHGEMPEPIADRIRQAGVTIYVGGLGVKTEYETLLETIAGVATNYKPLAGVADVTSFFTGAQAQAASAVITNARLRITPVNFATVTNFELVSRMEKVNYVPAADNIVPVGDVAQGDNYQFYLRLALQLPDDIKSGRRSFGKIELVGDVPFEGIHGQVLGSTPIAVMFSDQPVPTVNPTVKDMINTAATARELYRAGQAGSAAEAAQHVANARKTAAFSNDAVAAALKAQLSDIESKVASDPNAAQKAARRATRGFSAEDAAAALKNLARN